MSKWRIIARLRLCYYILCGQPMLLAYRIKVTDGKFVEKPLEINQECHVEGTFQRIKHE